MQLKFSKKEIEVEREIGYKYLQVLSRAEALVSGAGREAIVPLLWDANVAVIRAEVQNDRVVMDGTLSCQAVYQQGEETSLRALNAKANLSQATEINGAQQGMLARVQAVVEDVEVRYENGHMVFQVSLGMHIWVLKLENIEVIEAIENGENVETRFAETCLVKLAAEANETAVFTERVELPKALDARATLMDWGSVQIDSSEPDLGGIRVKGRTVIETLVASGIEGKPGVVVKYPIEFDKLIELPEWLSQGACVYPAVRNIRTQLEPGDEDEEGMLMLQADVHFEVAANLRQCVNVLEDIYSVSGVRLDVETEDVDVCTEVRCTQSNEIIRGTVLTEAGAPAVSSIIAVRALPNIAEITEQNGRSIIHGLLDLNILYMPVGSERPISSESQLPFEIQAHSALAEHAMVRICVASAEANALMGDRIEMKVNLNVYCESRIMKELEYVTGVEEGGAIQRKPGYVIYWPEEGEDAWNIGKKYAVTEKNVSEGAENGQVQPGKALVLRI